MGTRRNLQNTLVPEVKGQSHKGNNLDISNKACQQEDTYYLDIIIKKKCLHP